MAATLVFSLIRSRGSPLFFCMRDKAVSLPLCFSSCFLFFLFFFFLFFFERFSFVPAHGNPDAPM